MQPLLELDFRALQIELQRHDFVDGTVPFAAAADVIQAREHGYRRLDEHAFFHLLNLEVLHSYRLVMQRRGFVCVQIVLGGAYWRRVGERYDRVDSAAVEISSMPSSVTEADGGTRLRGLLIGCERQHLVDTFGIDVDRVPERHRRIFTGDHGEPEPMRLGSTHHMTGTVDQMLGCAFAEPLRTIYLRAKAAEVLCEIVATVNAASHLLEPRVLGTHRRRQAIQTAAAIYRRELSRPPAVEQLALRVGLNRNELTTGFRDAFGSTPHAYAQHVRMQHARELLRRGELSISEVGRRVGYEGYASFSRAFHAHFGFAPSTVLDVLL